MRVKWRRMTKEEERQLYQIYLEDQETDRRMREAMGEEEWARFCAETEAMGELTHHLICGGSLQ